jgi:hypothetical protein
MHPGHGRRRLRMKPLKWRNSIVTSGSEQPRDRQRQELLHEKAYRPSFVGSNRDSFLNSENRAKLYNCPVLCGVFRTEPYISLPRRWPARSHPLGESVFVQQSPQSVRKLRISIVAHCGDPKETPRTPATRGRKISSLSVSCPRCGRCSSPFGWKELR